MWLDGFLLNRVAASALKEIAVIESFESQQRPVEATFEWRAIVQDGHIHMKTAPLNLSNLSAYRFNTQRRCCHGLEIVVVRKI